MVISSVYFQECNLNNFYNKFQYHNIYNIQINMHVLFLSFSIFSAIIKIPGIVCTEIIVYYKKVRQADKIMYLLVHNRYK